MANIFDKLATRNTFARSQNTFFPQLDLKSRKLPETIESVGVYDEYEFSLKYSVRARLSCFPTAIEVARARVAAVRQLSHELYKDVIPHLYVALSAASGGDREATIKALTDALKATETNP